jgi:sugar/nucleoside kinase (ribokinase family)
VHHELDVLGIGNALVDVISHADEDFLVRQGLEKGTMHLIETERAEELYAAMGPGIEMSGGSASNTMAGLASLGGDGALLGRVRDDQLGTVFTHDIRAVGVEFAAPPAVTGPPTGRCLILVTPDAQRTMSTYLGASTLLGPDDVDEGLVARAKVTYLEGYLWDPPAAKEAFRKAMAAAHVAGRRVALSLSDPFCVARYRDEFLELVEGHHIDVLFANEVEICSLFEVDVFDDALQRVRGCCEIAVLTRHEKGSMILADDELHVIDIEPVTRVVDSTGAGDLYASGFLYGLTRDFDLATCGRLGAMAASEVISHVGARPATVLAALAEPLIDRV